MIPLHSENPLQARRPGWQTPLLQIHSACDDQQTQDKQQQQTALEPPPFTRAPRTKLHERPFASPPAGSRRAQTVWRPRTGSEQERLPTAAAAAAALDQDVTEMIRFGAGSIFRAQLETDARTYKRTHAAVIKTLAPIQPTWNSANK